MAANLTGQVRNIAQVTTAVANGDLAQKITVEAQGEVLQLKETINKMVDSLNVFAAEAKLKLFSILLEDFIYGVQGIVK